MAGKEQSMSKEARKGLWITFFLCYVLCEPLRMSRHSSIHLSSMKNWLWWERNARTGIGRRGLEPDKIAGETHVYPHTSHGWYPRLSSLYRGWATFLVVLPAVGVFSTKRVSAWMIVSIFLVLYARCSCLVPQARPTLMSISRSWSMLLAI